MSLARMALRIAATEAMRGKTLVGDRVLDSEVAALAPDADGNVQTEQEKPFIAVYTDAAVTTGEETADSWLIANGETEVILEYGVTTAMAVTNADGESEIVEGIPTTDQALEFTLDLIARQALDALADETNPWSKIYQGLYYHVAKVERGRVGTEAKGVRLAAQQIRITVHAIDDPIKGKEPNDPDYTLTPFIEALEASGNAVYARLAELMRAAL